MEWRVSEADERLIELLETVDETGPKEIQHEGKFYVISPRKTVEKNRLVEIITKGPSWDGLEIDGIPGDMRDIEL